MEGGYSLDTEATSGANSKGGSAWSGTGDMVYNAAAAGVPTWVIVAGAVAALFLLFRWKGKK